MSIKNDDLNKNDEKGTAVNRQAPSAEPQKQDLPEVKSTEEDKPQSYVHLADGSVIRAYDEDLPGSAGHGNANGFWQRGNKVYHIIGIHPVETEVAE